MAILPVKSKHHNIRTSWVTTGRLDIAESTSDVKRGTVLLKGAAPEAMLQSRLANYYGAQVFVPAEGASASTDFQLAAGMQIGSADLLYNERAIEQARSVSASEAALPHTILPFPNP